MSKSMDNSEFNELKCPTCGKSHDELPALAFSSPYYYAILSEEDKKEIAELTSDLCVIQHENQTDRFIRTTLCIPIIDYCEDLDYGLWVSVSEKSFNDYISEFNENKEGETYFGMISNDIPDYEESTLGLHVNVNILGEGYRPILSVHRVEHAIIKDLEHGITLEEAQKRIERMMNSINK